METTQTPPPVPARKRFRKRVVIPGVVLGVLLLLFVGFVIRGTWADREEKNPESVEDGIICQLYQDPSGRKQVRCAMLLDFPIDKIRWVVTNYDRYAEIFPTVQSGSAEQTGPDRYHWKGVVTSALGSWPVELDITEKHSEKSVVVSWRGTGDGVEFLEGNWTLISKGNAETLLVYTSEVELSGLPDFLVRNILLSRQKTVIAAVANWLRQPR
jgi:hypothetical protein